MLTVVGTLRAIARTMPGKFNLSLDVNLGVSVCFIFGAPNFGHTHTKITACRWVKDSGQTKAPGG